MCHIHTVYVWYACPVLLVLVGVDLPCNEVQVCWRKVLRSQIECLRLVILHFLSPEVKARNAQLCTNFSLQAILDLAALCQERRVKEGGCVAYVQVSVRKGSRQKVESLYARM